MKVIPTSFTPNPKIFTSKMIKKVNPNIKRNSFKDMPYKAIEQGNLDQQSVVTSLELAREDIEQFTKSQKQPLY